MFYLRNLLLGDNSSNSERNEEDDDDDDDDNNDGEREEEKKESTVGNRTDNTSFNSSHESVPLTPPILLSPFRFRSRPNASVVPVIPVIPQPAKIHVPATSISLPPSTSTPGSVPIPLIINREEEELSTPTSHVSNNINVNVIPNLDQNPESVSQQPAAFRRRFPPKPRMFSRTGESRNQQIYRCHSYLFDVNLTYFMSNF